MRKKQLDPKTIVIAVLTFLVLLQAFFLFIHKPKKITAVKKAKPPISQKKERVPEAVVVLPKKIIKEEEAVQKPTLGRIAIIVDDCGYNLQTCTFSSLIQSPMTFAILPDLPHSTDVAECVHNNGKDVMLHLPMEPHQYSEKYPENYIIKTTMSTAEIDRILTRAVDEIPYIIGVNNHMGSKATENEKVMRTVLSELQKRNLFFVDSMVTSLSVGKSIAKEIEIPFAKRDIFLDNINERGAIEEQFRLLANLAKRRGHAIAIGHDRKLTLQVIKEQTDKLTSEGFEFVNVHTLTHTP